MSPHDPARCEEILRDVRRVEEQGAVLLMAIQRRIAELESPPWWKQIFRFLWT